VRLEGSRCLISDQKHLIAQGRDLSEDMNIAFVKMVGVFVTESVEIVEVNELFEVLEAFMECQDSEG
jgi:hypothetical protein